MLSQEILTVHFYDDISREGIFKDENSNSIYVNFDYEDFSHELAVKLRTGSQVLAEVVRDTTFCQVARILEKVGG